MNFANNLRKIRKDNNLSQEQLAEKLGVSRQSVSKWESEQAYPEMEKLIQICDMFDVTMDEILNQNASAVKETKKEKNNISRHIDSFLNYITKTIDLVSSMTHMQRFKCIMEQIIYALIFTIICVIIGAVFSGILNSILCEFSNRAVNIIYNTLESIYIAICVLLGFTLLFQIFKIRYLNYCEIVSDTDSEKNLEIEKQDIEPKKFGKKILQREKIIIRDPNHSEYKFISGLVKIFLGTIKIFTGLFGILICLCLIAEFAALTVAFGICKSGLLFIGALLTIVSIIAATIIVLLCVYSILFNHKFRKIILLIVFICSLAFSGLGIGIGVIGTMKMEQISVNTTEFVETKTLKIKSADNFFVFETPDNYTNYIPNNSNEITVVATFPKYLNFNVSECDTGYDYNNIVITEENDTDIFPIIKEKINLLNQRCLPSDFCEVKIYTSQENINKMIENAKDYGKKSSE
ncbi:MAG: helix-turn-helix transcriptional regulator [Ruminococcus sp.]|nr:helix-turn-helix transcriptional regulator [Candidatus Copronaster equi]